MKRSFLISILFLSFLQVFPADRNEALLKSITRKLIAAVDTFPDSKKPVDVALKELNDVNAYAIPPCPHSKNPHYTIKIFTGLMSFLDADEEYLAMIIAHELSHILLNHVTVEECDSTSDEPNYISREQEKEADLLGLKIFLNAGYHYTKAIDAYKKMKFERGDYSSFEAQSAGADHPSWTERLEHIDQHQQELWRTMACFENGVYFLEMQAYEIAVILFKQVTKEFPNCCEAYANIGYARLMQYFDEITQEDIIGYHIGQLALGGFYRRPASLISQVKGPDEEKWWEALSYFNKSLACKPDQPLVMCYQGLAYFFDPRQLNVKESFKILSTVSNDIRTDTLLDSYTKAVLYNNIAALGINRDEEISVPLDEILSYALLASGKFRSKAFRENNLQLTGMSAIPDIVDFNYSYYRFTKGDTSEMNHEDYEQYLESFLSENAANVHVWWKNAYSIYSDVCRLNGHEPKNPTELMKSEKLSPPRSVTHVMVNDTLAIFLSQHADDVNKTLGKPDTVILSKERKLFSLLYPDHKIKVVISGDEIISIMVLENSSATIVMDGTPEMKLRINEPLPSEKIPQFSLDRPCKVDNEFEEYFFDELGISVLLTDNKIIKGIKITTEPFAGTY